MRDEQSADVIAADEVIEQARDLWQKYVILTKEMLKIITKKDVETFFDMVAQRGQLIELMKALPPNDFRQTQECRDMIEVIKPLDAQITYKARAWLNKSRRQTSAVKSYDLTSAFGNSGRIFNQKY